MVTCSGAQSKCGKRAIKGSFRRKLAETGGYSTATGWDSLPVLRATDWHGLAVPPRPFYGTRSTAQSLGSGGCAIHHRVAWRLVAKPLDSTAFAPNQARFDALIHIPTGTNLQPRRYINSSAVEVCVRGPAKA